MNTHTFSEPEKKLIPSLEQVKDFCKENNLSVNPERFYHYYQAREWKLGNGDTIKDWRSQIMSWEKSEFSKPKKTDTLPDYMQNQDTQDQEMSEEEIQYWKDEIERLKR